jgi:hypothetical protein
MSNKNAKNFLKDSNYEDFIQTEIGLKISTAKINAENTTFVVTPSKQTRAYYDNLNSKKTNRIGQLIEAISVKSIPGSFYSKSSFQNFISNGTSNKRIANHYTYYEKTQNIKDNNQTDYYHYFKSKYCNFYSQYEKNFFGLSERLFPNYYVESSDRQNIKTLRKNINSLTFLEEQYNINSNVEPRMRNFIIDNPKSTQANLEYYPMYIEFGFYNNSGGELLKALNDLGLMNVLIQNYIDNTNVSRESFEFKNVSETSEVITLDNYPVFSLLDWVQNQDYEINLEDKIFLNTENNNSFYTFRISKNILNGILNKMCKDKTRKYDEIINNKTSYNEVLFYKIDKYVGNIIGTPVQTLWITSEEEAIKYVDTQVKEGQIYSYDAKAVLAVFGNRYQFSNVVVDQETKQYEAKIDVINDSSIQLVEVPYFTEKYVALQPPPMTPEINIYTKKNSDNFVYIHFNKNIGTNTDDFIRIEQADTSQQEKIEMIAFNNASNMGFYESGDKEEYFELYRLTSPPKNYSDFANNKIMDAKLYLDNTKQNPSRVTIKDKILANNKFYYMMRAVNLHSTKSNPTIVYEVELIKDSDGSMVSVKQYHFPIPPQYQSKINFSSLFQIDPVFEQTLFNNAQDSLFNASSATNKLNNIKLGMSNDSIWGKTFKIRVTSKSTGKIMDFNINFDLDLVKTDKK